MPDEIVLPLGTQYVATADVPHLITHVLHPDVAGQPLTVSYFIKTGRPSASGETAKWNGWPIDDDDRKVLARLWADLPPLREHATVDEVGPYIEAANSANLDWTLGVCWTNPTLNSDINRVEAEKQHRQAIVSAIRRGELQVVAPNTRLPTNEFRSDSLVSVEELRKYVEQFKISVRVEVSEEPTETHMADAINKQATLWELRQPAAIYGEGFSPEIRKLTTLSKYLEYDTWTPEAAAMLVCGLQAPIEDGLLCTSIPERGAMGLDNGFLIGSQDPFHEARRLLGVWYSQENLPARVRPLDFIKWCRARGFDTSWLRSVEAETEKRTRDEMKSALGSGVVVLPRLRLLPAEWLPRQIGFSLVAIPDDERLVTVFKATVIEQTPSATHSAHERLTGADWRDVRAICGNPPTRCTRTQFDEWSAKFAAADNRPAWSLVGEFAPSDEMAKAQARWSEVVAAHEEQIAKWVGAGRLSLVTADGVETLDLRKGFIRIADAKQYLEHYHLPWRDATAHTERSNAAPTARELAAIGLTPEVWEGAATSQRDRILQNIKSTKEISDQVARQAIERHAQGRYTLNEAANEIADTGERLEPLLKKLCDAAQRGELPMYAPGESASYVYGGERRVRPYYEEAHCEDLNAWLERNEPRLKYRFPEPSTGEVDASPGASQAQLGMQSRALPQQRHQEQEIVRVIRELGHDPRAIPKWQSGKAGIKATVKAKLPAFSKKVFDNAWERLRKDGTIRDAAEHSPKLGE